MKRIISTFAIVTALICTIACNKEKHFISDKNYRTEMEKDYSNRPLHDERRAELSKIMNDENISLEEKEALMFLYAYMPLSDIADYSAEFFLEQVRGAFRARDNFSWGTKVPEDIFRHFVLVYRVNNENLDSARNVFFNELKDRIKDMNMYDAALEVNHWCHEKVTYRPSDSRTSAPLATMRTALGRCGEESTFTVTAMRSVGIPARQCYTPRWAHTDDNHAWVEVWVDGKWYYLGACEPDAKLNMGWFSIPATRCMMVHSNAFGKYKGDEEINYQNELFSRINMLSNYTDTRKITIKVTDNVGNAVADANVKFKLYNYAEYYPIATRTTDNLGQATLTTGLGDLLIWADKDGMYNYAKIDVRNELEITLSLDRKGGEEYTELFDICPPKEGRVAVELTEEEIAQNNTRLHYEDSVRNAYTSTFPKQDDIKNITNPNLTADQIWEIIHKSEGNYKEITKFLAGEPAMKNRLEYPFPLYDFMKSLADKDLRDCEANTLSQFVIYYNTNSNYSYDVYKKGILPARISNELIRPYHKYLAENLKIDNATAEDVRNWINQNITIDNDGNYYNCPISPKGVFDIRHSDKHSRDIFFVAACRSLNIPAYLDNATNQLFAYSDGEWKIYSFEEEKAKTETGKLVLNYTGNTEIKPQYWIHYTIAKFENGDFVTFDYENDPRVASFPINLDLEPGYYMLSTGNRYSDGTTLSKLTFFNIEAGKTVNQNIELRTLVPRKEVYGKMDLATSAPWKEGSTIGDYVKTKDLVLCFIDPNREPTRHLINDLAAFKNQFEQWNGTMAFLVPTSRMTKDFSAEKLAKQLPANAIIMEDKNNEWMRAMLKDTDQYFRDNYPLVFIVNKDGNLIFKTEGYRIGTGELIYKSLER